MPPSLSIVIPSHNRPDLLRACLRSVRRHSPANVETLVVDDASARLEASQVAAEFAGMRALRLSRRSGFCAAANHGIQAARGTVVELLNDDTEVTGGWAEPALKCFEDPGVAAVAPLVLRWPGEWADCQSATGGRTDRPSVLRKSGKALRIDSAGDRYYIGGVAAKRGHDRPLGETPLPPGPIFGASASSAFYRRQVLLQVGSFPESFGAYFEDVDLAFRIHRAGYRILFEPASRVLHHVSASYGLPERRLLEQQSRNEERVFWRNLPLGSLVAALPRHLAVLAAKGLRRWREGALIPFLCGRLRLLAEIPQLMDHRRRLQDFGPAPRLESWEVERRYWG